MKRSEIKNCNGLTLLELMIVIGLMAVFAILTIPYGLDFYQARVTEESVRSVYSVLSRAQSHATTNKGDSSWGVKFFHEENRYVFFKGERYDSRDVVYDQIFEMADGISMDGVSEVVFRKNTGEPKIFTE
jgi:prepilin-type N-terminal cleavage/methylation domain-containing protein